MLQVFQTISSLHQDAWQQGLWQNLRCCDMLRSKLTKTDPKLVQIDLFDWIRTQNRLSQTWCFSRFVAPVAQLPPHLQALQQEECTRKGRPGERMAEMSPDAIGTRVDWATQQLAWYLAGRSIRVRPKGNAVSVYELAFGVKPSSPNHTRNKTTVFFPARLSW